jgi:WD40 repeat protein
VCSAVSELILPLPRRREILPFVIVLVGSENMFVLTDAIVSTPLSLTVPARIGAGLNAAGVPIAVTVVSDVALMALIAAVVGVPAVREFCLFAICSLVVDFFMQMTFFVTVLSIDLQRLELADLLAQGGRGQAEPIGSPDEQDDTAVDSEDEDADALQPSSTRGPQPSSGRSERTDSYLKMSCKAAWRARTARTATLSGLLAALFGLYLYYGTGYQAEGVHGPTLPFAEAYPSSSVFGSQDVRPTSTHLSSQTFDPLAHLPSDAEQSVQQPWWQSSPSAPFWQALNPRGAPYVRIVVAPWTIVSLRGATSVGPEHARPVAFAAWALFRPRVRALIWFFKLSVLPIAGTTGLLWVLLLYLLKDTELLYAQEDKEDALFDDSATDRGAGDDSDREAAPPLKVQLTAARALHGSDVDYVAQDGDTVVSVAIDSSISVWRVGGPARSVASLHQTPSPGSAVSARAPQATCAAVDEAADLAAVGFRSGAISVLLLSSLAVVASATPTTSPVQHVCFVPRSDKGSAQLVSAHRDGSAYVWPAEHGASPGEVVAPRSEASWTSYAVPLAAAFSASMQQSDLVAFASSSSSLELRHWRAGRLESVFSLVGAPRALYRCVALSSLHFASSDSPESTPQPASRSSEPLVGTVLCGTLTGAVQAWDLSSSQLISSLDLNDGAILSLQVLPSSDAGSAPSDVALACTATSAFLLRLSGAPHAGPASELGISPGRPLNGLTLPSSPSGSRAGLPHLSGMRRPSDAGSQMMTPSNSGRVRSGSRPSSAGTGSLNAAGHVVGTETASTGVAPSPRSSRFRTSTDRVSLDVLDALRDGVLPGDSALRAIRREPIKRGGAVLARDPRGEPVVLGVRRRQAEDASRWELWHLQNAGCAAPQVYASESDLETSLLELESEEAAHPEADAPDASSAPAWPSLSLRPTALNGAGPSAMPLSFTRLKPVLLSTRGTSSIAAPQDTPPALLLGFGNSLAHVVPLRQNAGVVTLPDNSRASSELAGAQHMRRRGARRPSDYGI